MTEKTLRPQELKQERDKGEAEQLAIHFRLHPEQLLIPASLREAGPEIYKFEKMIALFESTHSLERLHSIMDVSPILEELFLFAPILADPRRVENDIKDFERYNPKYVPVYKEKIARLRATILSQEDAKKYELRVSAQRELIPIKEMLDILKGETDISTDKYEELYRDYRRLSRAVGWSRLNSRRIDHER